LLEPSIDMTDDIGRLRDVLLEMLERQRERGPEHRDAAAP
jgi:hypothetical protein